MAIGSDLFISLKGKKKKAKNFQKNRRKALSFLMEAVGLEQAGMVNCQPCAGAEGMSDAIPRDTAPRHGAAPCWP